MIDNDAILAAIMEVPAGPLAREQGARLVQAYIEHYGESDAARFRVLDVERSWHLWLDEWTLLCGQKDAKFDDGQAIPLLGEWKTHREARRTKAGAYYKGDAPEDWLAGISNGPQLGIYALHEVETTGADYARIMVRAVIKSTPVECWPPVPEDGIFILNRDYLAHLRNALLVRAAEIRAARALNVVPVDWLGYKCTHMYGAECVYYQPFCSKHLHPTGRKRIFSETDPGAAAIEAALKERGIDGMDPRLVILSASAYEEWSVCREKGRITQDGLGFGDDSEALQVGSVFHKGIATFYEQLQREQSVAK